MSDTLQKPEAADMMSIDRIATEFDKARRAGNGIPIQDWLELGAHLDPEELLEELLCLELANAIKPGSPGALQGTADTLRKQYPAMASVIDNEVRRLETRPSAESTIGLDSIADGNSAPDPETADLLDPTGYPPKYKPLRVLGQGGMGKVVLVLNQNIPGEGRLEALKLIREDKLISGSGSGYERAVERFEDEVKVAASLSHPNIVPIYTAGRCDRGPFFTMGYIQGESLYQLLDQQEGQNLPCDQATQIMIEVAHGVQYSHECGVVHRDLKPGNILVDPEGHPHVADFSLSQTLEKASTSTETGPLGTPHYMAPEQAVDASKTTARSDIYALGATLYHLVVGQPPLHTEEKLATDKMLSRIRTETAPSPRSLNSNVNRDLEAIILGCLEKKQEDRYQTVRDFREDLERYLKGEPVTARKIGAAEWVLRWSVLRPLWTLACLLLLGGVGGSVWATLEISKQKDKATAALAETKDAYRRESKERKEAARARDEYRRERDAKNQQLVKNYNQTGDLREQQGSMTSLLFYHKGLKLDPSPPELSLRRLRMALRNGPQIEHIFFHEETVSDAQFSPDGRYLMTACWDRKARVWDLKTGRECFSLTHKSLVTKAIFSPDGKSIATASEDRTARVWSAETGKPVTKPLSIGQPIISIAFGPKNERLAVAGGRPFQAIQAKTHLWKTKTILIPQRPIRIPGRPPIPRFKKVQTVVKGPPIYDIPRGRVVVWDITKQAPIARASLSNSGWFNDVKFSPDGAAFVTAGGQLGNRGQLNVVELTTGKKVAETMLRQAGDVQTVSFSPDGKHVLAASGRVGMANGEARIWDAKTGKQVGPILRHTGKVVAASWSPNGRQVLTASSDNNVCVWDFAGDQKESQTSQHPIFRIDLKTPLMGASFSPNGQWILTRDCQHRVRVWEASTGNPVTPYLRHRRPLLSANFGPQGTRLVTSTWDGIVRVWRIPVHLFAQPEHSSPSYLTFMKIDKTGDRIVVGRGSTYAMTFRVGSRMFSGMANQTTHLEVWDGRLKRRLFGKPVSRPDLHALSPDGRRLAMTNPVATERNGRSQTKVVVRDLERGQSVVEFQTSAKVHCLSCTSANKVFAVIEQPDMHDLQLVNVQGGKILASIKAPQQAAPKAPPKESKKPQTRTKEGTSPKVSHCQLSPTGKYLLVARSDRSVSIWDTSTGRQIGNKIAHEGYLSGTHFSPTEKQFLLVTKQGTFGQYWSGRVQIWNLAPFARVKGTPAHSGSINSATFSPDGRRVMTASDDHTAILWDAKTGKAMTRPFKHQGDVKSAVFSQDGKMVATVSSDHTARVWNVSTGEPLTPVLRHRMPVVGVSFTQDGRTLVTGEASRIGTGDVRFRSTLRKWDLAPPKVALSRMQDQVRLLSGRRLEDGDAAVFLSRDELKTLWGRFRKVR